VARARLLLCQPGYQREALEEIRRYVRDEGFVGVKLYNEYVSASRSSIRSWN